MHIQVLNSTTVRSLSTLPVHKLFKFQFFYKESVHTLFNLQSIKEIRAKFKNILPVENL